MTPEQLEKLLISRTLYGLPSVLNLLISKKEKVMKIENQVCTLEHAIKFATLGVKQSSLFYWAINSYNQEVKKITMHPDGRDIVYSAFSLSELSAMIKGGSYEAERLWNRMLSRINGGNSCSLFYKNTFLAEFLIEVLEAKYLSVEACNERLLA